VTARRSVIALTIAGLLVPRALRAQSLALGDGEVLRGRFLQQRFLQGFNAPLTSSGSFILAPHRGLIWRGETPFALLTVMGPGGLVQRVIGGATTRYPASQLPLLAQLFEVFSAALGGDWAKLGGIFDIQKTGTTQSWRVMLTPRRPDGDMPLQSVAVQGDRYVNSLVVTRVNGDRDHIEFSEQVPSRDPIDSEASELLAMTSRP
jgi:hypothetical protein